MKIALVLITLLYACTTLPLAHETETESPSREPGHEAKPQPAPKPRAKPVKPMPKPEVLCPPPKGPETEQQEMLRKLECLERD